MSISTNGTRIAVGSFDSDQQGGIKARMGKVRLFDWNGSDWTLVGTIYGRHPQDKFGAALSLSDDAKVVAVGAYGSDLHAKPGTAQVYQYQEGNQTWSQLGQSLIGINATDEQGFCYRQMVTSWRWEFPEV